MSNFNQNEDRACQSIEALLPQYIENLLAARTMLEVESHLTRCRTCSQQCRQLEATVNLLQSMDRLETSDDFMAKLHAKLDTVVPETGLHLSFFASLREMVYRLQQARTVPILSASMTMAGVIAFAILYHPMPLRTVPVPAAAKIGVEQPLQRNVALAAVNPFDDPAAANLEAHSAIQDSNLATISNE